MKVWIEPLHQDWGWDVCWQQDHTYWFLSPYNPYGDGPGIVWLSSIDVVMHQGRGHQGYVPAVGEYVHNVDFIRGRLPYSTRREAEKAWQKLLEDPLPFIVRMALNVD